MLTSLVIWNLNITVSTTTKIDGSDHEIFSKKITGLLNI